jgi:flagellar protein FlaG
MLNIDVVDRAKVAATSPIKASGSLSFQGDMSAKVAAASQAPVIDEATLSKAVKMLNDHVAPALQSIEFSLDQDSNRMVVKVVDTSTNKVLRQIPNEEALSISKSLGKLQGLMINKTA